MLNVQQARTRMCERLLPMPHERIGLRAAHGRTLAEALEASRDQPPFRSSAMDGYALRSTDLPLKMFTVIGESAAGDAFLGTLEEGEAVRIFTGAPVPEEADLVVPQERAHREGSALTLDEDWRASANIREVGIDFRAGAPLVAQGTVLNARHIALIAAAGIGSAAVSRRPRIALLATGTEIKTPGDEAGSYEIYDSVTFGVGAMVEDWGGQARRLPACPDVEAAVAAAVLRAVEEEDLVVIAGGASVGHFDIVKRALSHHGLEIAVPEVAVRPGKPTWFGTLRSKPILGLPGNPAAAFVCAHLFLKPLLQTLLGCAVLPECAPAALVGELVANGANEAYLRARADIGRDARLTVRAFGNQDTSLVSVFAAANALIRRPPGAAAARAGELVDTLLLSAPRSAAPENH